MTERGCGCDLSLPSSRPALRRARRRNHSEQQDDRRGQRPR